MGLNRKSLLKVIELRFGFEGWEEFALIPGVPKEMFQRDPMQTSEIP